MVNPDPLQPCPFVRFHCCPDGSKAHGSRWKHRFTLLPSSHLTNFFCCWLVAIGIIAVSGWLVHGWTSILAAGAGARGWLEIPAGGALPWLAAAMTILLILLSLLMRVSACICLLLLLFLLLLLLLMPLLLLLLIIACWRTLLGLSWGHHSCHFAAPPGSCFSILLTPLAASDFVSAAA